MAATSEMMPINVDPVPTKKPRSRKPLKEKTPSTNEANILAGAALDGAPAAKEKSKKGASKKAQKEAAEPFSIEKELLEMQEKLQQLTLEKEQTEELLKVKEEALKQEVEEKEKIQMEFKKLQKVKEFKPTMNLPMFQVLLDKEQDKKGKKKGDTEKKRPSPAYVLWCKDQWNEVKKANPQAEFKEISNLLGAKWKTITTEEKKPYEEKYQAEKEAYLKVVGNEKREHEAMRLLEEEQKQKTAMELLEQYMQFRQEAEKENKQKNKREKDPLKPKHPMSAFFVYSNERRPALLAENKNVLEVAKVLGEEWKNMTEEQRGPYEEIAMRNKEQYMHAMEIYKQKKEVEAASLKVEEDEMMKLQKQEALQLLKKKEKAENIIKKTKEIRQKKKKEEKEPVDPNKPKKPASSFFLFSKETRKTLVEERPGINNSTITALISVKWKELKDEEKQCWIEKAAKAMDVYKKELEVYNNKLAAEDQKS